MSSISLSYIQRLVFIKNLVLKLNNNYNYYCKIFSQVVCLKQGTGLKLFNYFIHFLLKVCMEGLIINSFNYFIHFLLKVCMKGSIINYYRLAHIITMRKNTKRSMFSAIDMPEVRFQRCDCYRYLLPRQVKFSKFK